jgi:hypothetical protein
LSVDVRCSIANKRKEEHLLGLDDTDDAIEEHGAMPELGGGCAPISGDLDPPILCGSPSALEPKVLFRSDAGRFAGDISFWHVGESPSNRAAVLEVLIQDDAQMRAAQ